jgi:tRNA U34 5-carboxymethylaminomethyl modifying GTPase MnmE/TrmE
MPRSEIRTLLSFRRAEIRRLQTEAGQAGRIHPSMVATVTRGKTATKDLLDSIFSQFCIGK